ncbi:shikimate kinase [Novosphingobium lentum]|uniref:shikimate kinase n=1 Tax=Novosphingobium lentum TaxID=145287 RepID=UPI000830F0FC|nr:shikimate kinase [Novosphingobium lentum]
MEVEAATLSGAEIARIARRIHRPIVLVGMMGVGKSTVGRKLATLLHLPFVDADDEIELAAQLTIPEIFSNYGEAFFRNGERRVIARLIDGKPMVLATGGGAFCDAETRALILDRALAVWLDSTVETLVERVARKDNRPLLRDGDPHEILSRLRNDRQSAYSQAPIHILSGATPHQQTAIRILKAIDEWL